MKPMESGHWTLSAVFACAVIHIGFAAFGIEEILHGMGESLGESMGTLEAH